VKEGIAQDFGCTATRRKKNQKKGEMAEGMCAASMRGAASTLLSSSRSMRGVVVQFHATKRLVNAEPFRTIVKAATESRRPGSSGTRYVGGKRVKVIQDGDKSAKIRDKVLEQPEAIKLLSRVEQLRLLSKAEKAGLLSTAENLGLSLSSIEKLGLLSKAEDLGVLSAATNPKTPGNLLATALVLFLLGPAFVYLVPEDSTPLVVLQVLVAAISVIGGSAAFAASSFVSTLQRSE
jgi:hypothetical protein